MHLVIMPVLADVVGAPYGGIFLVILSLLAIIRKS